MNASIANRIFSQEEARADSSRPAVAPAAPGVRRPQDGESIDDPSRSAPRPPRQSPDGDIARLVLAARAGDKASWDILVDRFNGPLWAVVRGYRLGDADAADVVQVTWLRLVENLDRLHNPASVGGWLTTTARRECLRILNTNKRQLLIGDDIVDQESPVPLPEESLVHRERHQATRRALSQLPERDQALLRLLTAEPSLRYSEISAALCIPIGSIGPTRQRALQRLREALETQGAITLIAE